jgi:hypothetical protein
LKGTEIAPSQAQQLAVNLRGIPVKVAPQAENSGIVDLRLSFRYAGKVSEKKSCLISPT